MGASTMMAMGTVWVEGGWIDGAWVDGSWADVAEIVVINKVVHGATPEATIRMATPKKTTRILTTE